MEKPGQRITGPKTVNQQELKSPGSPAVVSARTGSFYRVELLLTFLLWVAAGEYFYYVLFVKTTFLQMLRTITGNLIAVVVIFAFEVLWVLLNRSIAFRQKGKTGRPAYPETKVVTFFDVDPSLFDAVKNKSRLNVTLQGNRLDIENLR